MVQQALDHLGGCTYVEIGVENGATLRAVQAARRIGVDPQFLGRRMRVKLGVSRVKRALRLRNGDLLFDMPSDKFFASEQQLLRRHPIDVALVDGLHTAEQSLRDIEHCLRYGAQSSLIVVHDCNPQSECAALPTLGVALRHPEFTGEWNGDVYRAIVRLRATRADLNVCVLDCDEGVGVVTQGEPDDMLDLSDPEIDEMTYEDLVVDRGRLLNLRPPAHLEEVLDRVCDPRFNGHDPT